MKYILISLFILGSLNSSIAQCEEPSMDIWKDTWQSCQPSENPSASGNGHWIQYDLGSTYVISKAHVWNTNDPDKINNGFKEVTVEYSIDGKSWIKLGDYTFPKADGDAIYGGFEGFDFEGKQARYVLITASSNWGGECYGIAEIKFNLLFNGIPGNDNDQQATVCDPPSSYNILERTTTEIHFEWDPINNVEEYLIVYRPIGGEWDEVDTDEPEIFIEFLQPDTDYEFYLISICDEDVESDDSDRFVISTLKDDMLLDTDELDEEIRLELFPNPARNTASLLVESEYIGIAELSIVNLMGQSIYQKQITIQSDSNLYLLPADRLASGIYFVVVDIEEEGERVTKRLVVVE